jgi:integrase
MRLGEVLGLRWRDVDLGAGCLHIASAIQWTGRDFAFVGPKTNRARRTISLSPSVVAWLRRVRADQGARRLRLGEAWRDLDLVLEAGDGRPMRTDSTSSAFSRLMRSQGLRPFTFHALRHGHAIALLLAGCNPKVVSERLGHSSVAFTMDVYSEVLPAMQEQAASAIEDVIGSAIGLASAGL